jgi:methyl-accepting chemotaxis protein
MKGNTDGTVKSNLEAGSKEITAAMDHLVAVAKVDDHAALTTATADVVKAVRAFSAKDADERDRARADEQVRVQKEKMRADKIKGLNSTFKDSVGVSMTHLNDAVEQLSSTSNVMAKDAEESSKQLIAVAAASEELSASIKEIARQIAHSNDVVQQAKEEAKQTRTVV